MDNGNNDKSYEPMDIDTSANSNYNMDVSYNLSPAKVTGYCGSDTTDFQHLNDHTVPESFENIALPSETPDIRSSSKLTELHIENVQQPVNIKKFHILRHKETNTLKISSISFILFAVLASILAIIGYHIQTYQCSDDIEPKVLQKLLSEKVYGQSRAIDTLIEALTVKDRSKILLLYGGTGVGKTLTASLIMDHVGYHSNIYHYTMPSFMNTFTTDFMIGLTVCKHSTIIIDDLSADVDIKTHIKDVITKSQELDKSITIFLIYNCDNIDKDFNKQCDDLLQYKVFDNFKFINAFKKVVKYEQLKEEHLRQCIENELGHKKIKDHEFNKILKYFNVSIDGCKGVHTKVKLLEIL